MRISDCSTDVCSSDVRRFTKGPPARKAGELGETDWILTGRRRRAEREHPPAAHRIKMRARANTPPHPRRISEPECRQVPALAPWKFNTLAYGRQGRRSGTDGSSVTSTTGDSLRSRPGRPTPQSRSHDATP